MSQAITVNLTMSIYIHALCMARLVQIMIATIQSISRIICDMVIWHYYKIETQHVLWLCSHVC